METTTLPRPPRVGLVSLGCPKALVDSERIITKLRADGYQMSPDYAGADVVLVNTCGFIETAKKDSVDAILAATDSGASVVAVGCMAERYGSELAGALPEATVLGFDDYAAIGDRLDDVLTGRPLVPHDPRDRRTLLPISPAARTAAVGAGEAWAWGGAAGAAAAGPCALFAIGLAVYAPAASAVRGSRAGRPAWRADAGSGGRGHFYLSSRRGTGGLSGEQPGLTRGPGHDSRLVLQP